MAKYGNINICMYILGKKKIQQFYKQKNNTNNIYK